MAKKTKTEAIEEQSVEETAEDVALVDVDGGKKAEGNEEVSFPAMRVEQGNCTFYVLTLPIGTLRGICYVDRVGDPDTSAGFQRGLNEKKVGEIAEYLSDADNCIPQNIVLSVQDEAGLKYSRQNKSISFKRVARAFNVLDGQHRLAGYFNCEKLTEKDRVFVAVCEGFSRAKEARIFMDVNVKQTGVPSALLTEVKHIAEAESAVEVKLRDWYDWLASNDKSLLSRNNLCSPAGTEAGKLSRMTFNRSCGSVLFRKELSDIKIEVLRVMVREYINGLIEGAKAAEQPLLLAVRPMVLGPAMACFTDAIRWCVTKQTKANAEGMREAGRLAYKAIKSVPPRSTKKYIVDSLGFEFGMPIKVDPMGGEE